MRTIEFSDIDISEFEPGLWGLSFTDLELLAEDFSRHDIDSDGYTLESLVLSALEMNKISITDVNFDSESDMFAAYSQLKAPLMVVAGIVFDLGTNQEILERTIANAKKTGQL